MKLILPYKIKEKMRLYVNSLNNEISGFGKIKFNDDIIIVEDIKIFKQTVTSGSSELDGESIAKFMTEITKKGESLENWNLWWHSHNDMGVFWSGTDTGTMDKNPLDAPYMVSLVTNNKEEYKVRLDIYNPTHVHVDDIDVSINLPQDNTLKKQIEKEVKDLVTIPTKTIIYSTKNKHQKSFTSIKEYGGYWNHEEKAWFTEKQEKEEEKYSTYDHALYQQQLTDAQIKEEGKKMAEQFTLNELTITLHKAEEDMDISFDTYAIIEKAYNIKSEISKAKKHKKNKKKIKKSKKK